MTMNKNRNINWEIKQIYLACDYTGKIPNRKRAVRYGQTKREKQLAKYGLSNCITRGDEFIA